MAKQTAKKVTKKVAPKATKKATKKVAKKTDAPVTTKKKTPPLRTDDREFAIQAARIAQDRHCTEIVLLDLRGLSPATDYFLIATGTSDRQSRTVADEIMMLAKKEFDLHCFGKAGYDKGQWILLDFVSVVVHIFEDRYRDYYNLDMLWGDAPKLTIDY